MQRTLFEERDEGLEPVESTGRVIPVRIPGPISRETKLRKAGPLSMSGTAKYKSAKDRATSDEERALDAYFAIPSGVAHIHRRRAAMDEVIEAREAADAERRRKLSSFPY